MEIHGWIAVSKHGLILASFREDPTEAGTAARIVLRLAGGPPLVAGFHLVKARLVIDDEADCLPSRETEKTE